MHCNKGSTPVKKTRVYLAVVIVCGAGVSGAGPTNKPSDKDLLSCSGQIKTEKKSHVTGNFGNLLNFENFEETEKESFILEKSW